MLKNKIIVVTGGSGLLGNAFLEECINQGAQAICLDLVPNKNPQIESHTCDATDERQVKQTIDAILHKHGRIDGWVNNAYPRTKDWGTKVEDLLMESWRKNVDMHMNSYFMCSRLALEAMKPKEKGSVINLASIYGILGPDFTVYEGTEMSNPAAYAAIKGGIINFSRYLASNYGKHNLRVNCISPGGIFDNQNEIFVNNYNKKVPMKRMGSPADIAPSIAFLLSDQSSYITGHNLVIDGGWSIV
jgi:NAD(P)-dependent dehydrogenase (short-subunit alcohol dehydrogenase family)